LKNPWEGFHKSAPFDREYFLILNVAVGGTGYFSDDFTNEGGKPWINTSPQVGSVVYENLIVAFF